MKEQNTPQRNPSGSADTFSTARVSGLAMEFAVVIAVPLIALVFVGKWLDQKYSHEHYYDLIGILLAILFSTSVLYRRIKSIRKGLARKT